MTPMLLARRQFFRGESGSRTSALRPPWALAEAAFERACTRCHACIDACPTQLLVSGGGGFPEADFSRSECNFCGECVRVCLPGALTRANPGAAPWAHVAAIGQNCLALRQVDCRLCAEHCSEEAIRFELRLGGAARPVLDATRCNGCGACVRVCPTHAMHMTRLG